MWLRIFFQSHYWRAHLLKFTENCFAWGGEGSLWMRQWWDQCWLGCTKPTSLLWQRDKADKNQCFGSRSPPDSLLLDFPAPDPLKILTEPDPAPDVAYSSEYHVNKLKNMSLSYVFFFPMVTRSIYLQLKKLFITMWRFKQGKSPGLPVTVFFSRKTSEFLDKNWYLYPCIFW